MLLGQLLVLLDLYLERDRNALLLGWLGEQSLDSRCWVRDTIWYGHEIRDFEPQLGFKDMLVSARVLHAQQDQGAALLHEPHLPLILLLGNHCISKGIMYEQLDFLTAAPRASLMHRLLRLSLRLLQEVFSSVALSIFRFQDDSTYEKMPVYNLRNDLILHALKFLFQSLEKLEA